MFSPLLYLALLRPAAADDPCAGTAPAPEASAMGEQLFVLCATIKGDQVSLWPSPSNPRPAPLRGDTVRVVVATVKDPPEGVLEVQSAGPREQGRDRGEPEPTRFFATLAPTQGTAVDLGRFESGELQVTAQLVPPTPSPGETDTPEPPGPVGKVTVDVPEANTGMLRLGAALINGPAAGTEYYAQASGVDGTPRIFDAGTGRNVELVIGYTRYLQRKDETDGSLHISPTAALGLVDTKDLTVTPLQSVYLGLDVGWQDLSIAFTATLRKVPSLAGDLQVGSTTASTDNVLTRDVWQAGFAIILFTPSLLNTKG